MNNKCLITFIILLFSYTIPCVAQLKIIKQKPLQFLITTGIINEDNSVYCLGDTEGNVYVRDLLNGNTIASFKALDAAIYSLSINAKNGWLFAGSNETHDKSVKLWDYNNEKLIKSFRVRYHINQVAFNWNSGFVVIYSSDGRGNGIIQRHKVEDDLNFNVDYFTYIDQLDTESGFLDRNGNFHFGNKKLILTDDFWKPIRIEGDEANIIHQDSLLKNETFEIKSADDTYSIKINQRDTLQNTNRGIAYTLVGQSNVTLRIEKWGKESNRSLDHYYLNGYEASNEFCAALEQSGLFASSILPNECSMYVKNEKKLHISSENELLLLANQDTLDGFTVEFKNQSDALKYGNALLYGVDPIKKKFLFGYAFSNLVFEGYWTNDDQLELGDYYGIEIPTLSRIATSPVGNAALFYSNQEITLNNTSSFYQRDNPSYALDNFQGKHVTPIVISNNGIIGNYPRQESTYQLILDATFTSDGKTLYAITDKGYVTGWHLIETSDSIASHQFISKKFSNTRGACLATEKNGASVIICDDTGECFHMKPPSGIHQVEKLNDYLVARFQLPIIPERIDFINNRLYGHNSSNEFVLYDLQKQEPVITIYQGKANEYVVINNQGFYYTNTRTIDFLSFKKGKEIFDFEQFDLQLNQPHRVLSSFSSFDKELYNTYESAFHRRLRSFPENTLEKALSIKAPTVKISNEKDIYSSSDLLVPISIQADAFSNSLQNLDLSINKVPLFGKEGLVIGNNHIDTTFQIELLPGSNYFEISATNDQGIKSKVKRINIDRPSDKIGLGEVFYVGLGASQFKNEDSKLYYATKDVKDIGTLLSEKMKRPFHSLILNDEDLIKENLAIVRDFLSQAQTNDLVIMHLASHGVLGGGNEFYLATHDMDFHNPISRGISFTTIEDILYDIKSRQKLLMIDACHAGESGSEESVSAPQTPGLVYYGDDFNENRFTSTKSYSTMKNLFLDLRSNSGTTMIAASTDRGISQESNLWDNGAFTYCVIQGLTGKADANKDGKIKVSELEEYLLHEVPKLTNGLQTPTLRQENILQDFTILTKR